MRIGWVITFVMFWFCSFQVDGSDGHRKDSLRVPLKVKGEWPSSPLHISDVVINFEDTIGVTHRISRLLNEADSPEGYVSHIETPVCTDTLCALMDIRMFWTLAGTYWAFDTIPKKPLTKNDHIKFDEKDYAKLHELLLDEQSILRRRHKDDLFEKEEKRVSQVVDAVTGATAKEVKEAVVDGAVYSSFTIYHLVHSQLAAVIREDFKNNLMSSLGDRLISSEKIDERIFFIRELSPNGINQYLEKIVETIPAAVPRDRLYIMKKIPAPQWEDGNIQANVARMARDLDIHSLSYFLNQLRTAKTINPECIRALSEAIPGFSVNQVRTYLSLLEKDPEVLKDSVVLAAIRSAASNPQYQYSTYLKSFLAKQGIELQ